MATLTEEIRKTLDLLEHAGEQQFLPGMNQPPSKEFISALNMYVNGSYHYFTRPQKAYIQQHFDAEMPVLAESHLVWRGMALTGWDGLAAESDFRDKDEIRFNDYMSTSKNYATAENIIDNADPDRPIRIMLKITTLAGARGIKVWEYDGVKIEVPDGPAAEADFDEYGGEEYEPGDVQWAEEPELAKVSEEEEIILDRTAVFEVISKSSHEDDSGQYGPGVVEWWDVELRQIK